MKNLIRTFAGIYFAFTGIFLLTALFCPNMVTPENSITKSWDTGQAVLLGYMSLLSFFSSKILLSK